MIQYVPISGSVSVTGNSSVDSGILAGRLEGSVIGVSTAGTVSGAGSDGGLVGTNAGGSITDSDSTATVTGNDANIGGLVGNQNSGTVQNVYATGTVTNSGSEYSGGLIGDIGGGTLVTGYAVGKVSGGYTVAILGLYDSYSSPVVSSVYFDPVLSGTSHAVGFNSASGMTASTNLTSESTFSGWNFTSVWHLSPIVNNGFPYLLDTHVIRTSSPVLPIWTPPVITTEPVTIGKNTSQVIGNMGYNAVQAITGGSAPGYEEERAAIQAGASATGEGIDSSYLSAILSGSGVGLQRHVSAQDQGQFAALYQHLKIIPTWTNNTVITQQAIHILLANHAPTLAIENYLVQFDSFS